MRQKVMTAATPCTAIDVSTVATPPPVYLDTPAVLMVCRPTRALMTVTWRAIAQGPDGKQVRPQLKREELIAGSAGGT